MKQYSFHEVVLAQKKKEGYVGEFFEVFLTRKISRYLTWLLSRTSIHPHQVVVFSFVVSLVGIVLFGLKMYLLGAVFFFLGRVLDCVDGELARLKGLKTDYGRWLDYSLDAVTFFLLVVSLVIASIGAYPVFFVLGVGYAALLATSMMFFQSAWSVVVFRDILDFHESMKMRGSAYLSRMMGLPVKMPYSGETQMILLFICLALGSPFYFLVVHAVVGNIYWIARFFLYRGL